MNKELKLNPCWRNYSNFPEWLKSTRILDLLHKDHYLEFKATKEELAEWFLDTFPLEATSGFVLKWMRDVHKIYIYVDRESIGSNICL